MFTAACKSFVVMREIIDSLICENPKDLLHRGSRLIKQIIGCQVVMIFQFKEDQNYLELIHCSETKNRDHKKPYMLKQGEGAAGYCAFKREPLIIQNATSDSRYKKNEDALVGLSVKTESLLVVPIINSQNSLTGTLQL